MARVITAALRAASATIDPAVHRVPVTVMCVVIRAVLVIAMVADAIEVATVVDVIETSAMTTSADDAVAADASSDRHRL